MERVLIQRRLAPVTQLAAKYNSSVLLRSMTEE